jgi:hypothetical protein
MVSVLSFHKYCLHNIENINRDNGIMQKVLGRKWKTNYSGAVAAVFLLFMLMIIQVFAAFCHGDDP